MASTATTLALSRDDPSTPADEGRSFVFVSGLGGRSIRDQQLSGPWWASIYTSTQGATYGALFGVFDYRGDPGLAHFYFKDIGGRVADEFFVRSAAVEQPPPCITAACDCRGRPDAAPCDDGDACTMSDTCSPGGGCVHRPIVLADLRSGLRRLRAGACRGQPVPRSVARVLGRARSLLVRADATSSSARAGRFITRALRVLSHGRAALTSAQRRVSPSCAATLRQRFDDAQTGLSCLLQGP